MTTAARIGYRGDAPCVSVKLPKSTSTRDEMTVVSRDECALLLSKVSPHHQPLVLAFVATGPRWGEAMALTAGDMDCRRGRRRPGSRSRGSGMWTGAGASCRRRPSARGGRSRCRRRGRCPGRWSPARRRTSCCSPTPLGQISSSRFWTIWTQKLNAAYNPRRPTRRQIRTHTAAHEAPTCARPRPHARVVDDSRRDGPVRSSAAARPRSLRRRRPTPTCSPTNSTLAGVRPDVRWRGSPVLGLPDVAATRPYCGWRTDERGFPCWLRSLGPSAER